MSKQAVTPKKQTPEKQKSAKGQPSVSKRPAPKKQPVRAGGVSASARTLPAQKSPALRSLLCWLIPFFFIFVFSADGAAISLNIFMTIIVAALLIFRRSRLEPRRINLQFVFVLAYVVFAGISCFYANSGALAIKEIAKLLLALCVYLLVVLLSRPGKAVGRNVASAASVTAAIISFLSIDLVSTRWFSGVFLNFTAGFTNDYPQTGLEPGTRILSILEDPNIFAGVAAVGVLLALGLALSSAGRERRVHVVCLGISSLGFLLSFSIGSSVFLAVAAVAFVLLLPKDKRAEAILLLLADLLLTLLCAYLCYKSVFDGKSTFSLVPLLCIIFGSAALCVLDRRALPPLNLRLQRSGKAPLRALLCLVGLIAVYAVAAVNVTGPAAFSARTTLERAAYLSAGSYTAVAQSTTPVTVKVESQNDAQLIMHTSSELYSGDASGAAFAVPDNSEIVKFTFSAQEPSTLSSFSYTGTESGALKLNYKLLPGFISNRLQGLQKNENAIQRVEFWRAAIHLWQKSPVFGNGLSCYEADLYSVSSFFYMTKYAHNHYLQLLSDLGILGLLLFLGILLSSGRMLVLARKKDGASPLLSCLGAALLFMVLQAFIQVDFSSHAFLLFAFVLFALMNVCTAESVETDGIFTRQPRLPDILRHCTVAFLLVWAVLCCGNRIAPSLFASNGDYYNNLVTAMRIDPLDRDSYRLSYISSAMKDESAVPKASAERYAEIMKNRPANFDPSYPAEYFFGEHELPQAFMALEAHLAYNRSRSEAWQYAFDLLAKQDNGSAEFRAGAKKIVASLKVWDAEAMTPIELTDSNREYLGKIGETVQ